LSASPGIPAAMEGIGLRPSFVCATHLLHTIGLAGLLEADRSSLIPGGINPRNDGTQRALAR
jgi:hypothetical protein